jgi:hypothetical protein
VDVHVLTLFKGLWRCNLVPTGKYKHCQATIPKRLRMHLSIDGWARKNVDQWKESAHMVWWRHTFRGARIPKGLQLSHFHADPHVLETVAETWDLNESRKFCHMFWVFGGECPHVYCPCQP